MIPNFGLITIQRVCIHLVHKKEKGQEHSEPEYDGTIIPLDQDVHDILTTRLRTYCGTRSRSFELIIEKGLDISFFGHAHTLRQAADPDFIEKTKAIALLLAQSQTTARPPASCLVVLDAVAEDGLPVVICIKAELTEALTQEVINGVSNLKKVEKLFMGRQEKFFKLGIIYKLSNAEILELEAKQEEPLLPQQEWGAILYDHQFRSNTRPAEYFWKDFLGFSIANNEKIKLKQLYDSTMSFINDKITDVETRSEMKARLEDYISNANVDQVDPSFIMDNIVPEDKRDAFDETIREEFPRPFTKDTALVANKIAKSRMEFPSKLVFSGPRPAFAAVQVIESQAELDRLRYEPGFTIIRIEGSPDIIPNLRYVE